MFSFSSIFSTFFVLSSSFDLPAEAILLAILFPIKSPVAYSVFWTILLEAVFAGSIPVFVAVSNRFSLYLPPPDFLWNDKKPYRSSYWMYFDSVKYLIYNNIYSVIKNKFNLSSTSSALLAWSLKQTSIEENTVWIDFINVKECGEILIIFPSFLFRTKVNETFEVCLISFDQIIMN